MNAAAGTEGKPCILEAPSPPIWQTLLARTKTPGQAYYRHSPTPVRPASLRTLGVLREHLLEGLDQVRHGRH
jgi:hypothetical protein